MIISNISGLKKTTTHHKIIPLFYYTLFFTYGVACGALRSITCQSVDVVVVPSKLKNSVHRAKITIEAIIVRFIRGTGVIQGWLMIVRENDHIIHTFRLKQGYQGG